MGSREEGVLVKIQGKRTIVFSGCLRFPGKSVSMAYTQESRDLQGMGCAGVAERTSLILGLVRATSPAAVDMGCEYESDAIVSLGESGVHGSLASEIFFAC